MRRTEATTVTQRRVRLEDSAPAKTPERVIVVILDLDTVYRLPWAGFEVYPYRVYTQWWQASPDDPWQPIMAHVMCRKYPNSCIPVQVYYHDPGAEWSRCPRWIVEKITDNQPTPQDLEAEGTT